MSQLPTGEVTSPAQSIISPSQSVISPSHTIIMGEIGLKHAFLWFKDKIDVLVKLTCTDGLRVN